MIICRQWMYLEPIFTSEDITKQLPVESKKYKSMERTWKRIMRTTYNAPNVIHNQETMNIFLICFSLLSF